MRVALTFDDGPSVWTVPILDLLAEHDAHATFFVIGNNIKLNTGTLERVLAAGHEIGNHTTTHPRLSSLGPEETRRELERTQELLVNEAGVFPTLWRAPHFDLPDTARKIAANLGLKHVPCSIDPGDWANPSAAGIADHVSRNLRDGDIVDLHDGIPPNGGTGTKSRQPTVEAVAILLAELTDVDFVTVADL